MIINREVLNSKPVREERCTDIDLFEYTLETASIMNNDIMLFTEAIGGGNKSKKIINFGAIINAIIDALINALKKLFRKFLAFLAELASMGSSFEIELRRFKEKIKALNKPVELDFPYYEFTNIEPGYPPFDVYDRITDMITGYDIKFNNIIKNPGSAPGKLVELQNEINVQEKQNVFRNMMLDPKYNTEDIGDYAVKLFSFFRNNSSTPKNNVVIKGSDIYDKYYIPYIEAKKEITTLRREQDNVEKNIRQVKTKIKKEFFKVDLSLFDTSSANEVSTTIMNIERQILSILDLMSQDLLLFFGQKLQAYKDFKLQSRKVLVCAIKACIVD